MLKKLQKKQIYIIAAAGLAAFLAGAMLSAPQIQQYVAQWLKQIKNAPQPPTQSYQPRSPVFQLTLLSPPERAAQLEKLAQGSPSPDRNRARYLLASDFIEAKEAKKAIDLLAGLEKDYPALAPYILLKQAQAYDLLQEQGKASDCRQAVLKRYPEHPAAAKALYLIGLPEYQDKAIAKFPSHPLSWEIIRKRLQENPNQPKLQLILAKYAYDQPGILPVLDLLSKNTTLKPDQWELVANGYWQNNQFAKAANVYTRATVTPRNLYRMARGWQISKKTVQAIAAYKKLVSTFPQARETGSALLYLAQMTKTPKQALSYLDRVINQFPLQAGKALLAKAKILQAQNDTKGATQALELLLSKYPQTEEAAEYRWTMAQQTAKTADYRTASQWAQPIPINNPNSTLAPRAAFWLGKWAIKLGKKQEAKQAYEYVLSQFPYSYYAWRSAVILGLNVGNFNNVRQLQPEIVFLGRPVPPAGSDTFKELYLLAQDRDAWLQWETEFLDKTEPTVAEQFTDGLVHLTRGENLIGIDKISKLEDREKPEEKADYEALSKQITYWQARYPFPFFQEIKYWSQKRQLNPLLVTALIRQESRFEPKIKSVANAVGLMQVLPSTAQWIAPRINVDSKKIDLENPNDNLMLGTWYLDYTHQQYANNSLLAIASYNAGPGNVTKWLQTLPKEDPDEFVEAIPFDETRNYVRQVFGNYWNYLRLYNPEISQIVGQYSAKHPKLQSAN
jgi:soluble lytic murein transglycosylase